MQIKDKMHEYQANELDEELTGAVYQQADTLARMRVINRLLVLMYNQIGRPFKEGMRTLTNDH